MGENLCSLDVNCEPGPTGDNSMLVQQTHSCSGLLRHEAKGTGNADEDLSRRPCMCGLGTGVTEMGNAVSE